MWTTILSGAFGLVTSAFQGFFGIKDKQLDMVGKGIDVLGDANSSSAQRETAIAQVLSSEMSNGYWLSAVWRPLVMVGITILVACYFFGYVTPNLLVPMPANSLIGELFEILKIGIMGYMPLRSIEKIVSQINLGMVVKKFIDSRMK